MKKHLRLDYRKLIIHNVFSFSFETLFFYENWEKVVKSLTEKYLKNLSTQESNYFSNYNPKSNRHLSIPFVKDSIRLDFDKFVFLNQFIDSRTVSKFNVNIEPCLSLNIFGSGTLDLKITVDDQNGKAISTREALFFLNLNEFSIKINNSTYPGDTLADICFQFINQKVLVLLNKKRILIKEQFSYNEEYLKNQLNQKPYIITELELSKLTPFDYLKSTDLDSETKKLNIFDLNSLLIRTLAASDELANQIDLKYIGFLGDNNGSEIPNLYPFNHLYSNIHVRSCIIIYGDYENPYLKKCGADFIESLIDTIKNVKTNWFRYFQMLQTLDKSIEEITKNNYRTFQSAKISGKEEESLENIFKQIINIRTSAILTISDYTMHNYRSGALNYVYNKLNEINNSEEIVNIIYEKIEYLGQLYDDFIELYRFKIRKTN